MMQLGLVEELGSGVLNVSKYWKAYSSGTKPQFIEGATFKIMLPVSEHFFAGNEDGNQDSNQYGNYDAVSDAVNRHIDGGVNGGVNDGANDGVNDGVNDGARKELIDLVAVIMSNEGLKAIDIAAKRGKSKPTIERYLKLARQLGIIEFRGATKSGGYYITKLLRDSIENKETE